MNISHKLAFFLLSLLCTTLHFSSYLFTTLLDAFHFTALLDDLATLLDDLTTLLDDMTTLLDDLTTLLDDFTTLLDYLTTLLDHLTTILDDFNTFGRFMSDYALERRRQHESYTVTVGIRKKVTISFGASNRRIALHEVMEP
jgi:hypothetical protein